MPDDAPPRKDQRMEWVVVVVVFVLALFFGANAVLHRGAMRLLSALAGLVATAGGIFLIGFLTAVG